MGLSGEGFIEIMSFQFLNFKTFNKISPWIWRHQNRKQHTLAGPDAWTCRNQEFSSWMSMIIAIIRPVSFPLLFRWE